MVLVYFLWAFRDQPAAMPSVTAAQKV
jgi:hypothetical protein